VLTSFECVSRVGWLRGFAHPRRYHS
jgi:hypothetical protein